MWLENLAIRGSAVTAPGPGAVRRSRPWRAVAAVALLASLQACTPMDNLMHAVFGRSMHSQPSFDPYEATRLPAEGAVPFAAGNYPAQLGADVAGGVVGNLPDLPAFTMAEMPPPGSDRIRALENPVEPTDESLARGEALYNRYCAVCHGMTGMSAEAPIIEKLPLMGAYNLASGAATGYPDGYIYAMIRMGRGLMPSYGQRVPHEDRWHVVNYVRQLQGADAQTAAQGDVDRAAPAAPGADPGSGGDTTGASPDSAGAAGGGEGS